MERHTSEKGRGRAKRRARGQGSTVEWKACPIANECGVVPLVSMARYHRRLGIPMSGHRSRVVAGIGAGCHKGEVRVAVVLPGVRTRSIVFGGNSLCCLSQSTREKWGGGIAMDGGLQGGWVGGGYQRGEIEERAKFGMARRKFSMLQSGDQNTHPHPWQIGYGSLWSHTNKQNATLHIV